VQRELKKPFFQPRLVLALSFCAAVPSQAATMNVTYALTGSGSGDPLNPPLIGTAVTRTQIPEYHLYGYLAAFKSWNPQSCLYSNPGAKTIHRKRIASSSTYIRDRHQQQLRPGFVCNRPGI
jgi:hypothetical protein